MKYYSFADLSLCQNRNCSSQWVNCLMISNGSSLRRLYSPGNGYISQLQKRNIFKRAFGRGYVSFQEGSWFGVIDIFTHYLRIYPPPQSKRKPDHLPIPSIFEVQAVSFREGNVPRYSPNKGVLPFFITNELPENSIPNELQPIILMDGLPNYRIS